MGKTIIAIITPRNYNFFMQDNNHTEKNIISPLTFEYPRKTNLSANMSIISNSDNIEKVKNKLMFYMRKEFYKLNGNRAKILEEIRLKQPWYKDDYKWEWDRMKKKIELLSPQLSLPQIIRHIIIEANTYEDSYPRDVKINWKKKTIVYTDEIVWSDIQDINNYVPKKPSQLHEFIDRHLQFSINNGVLYVKTLDPLNQGIHISHKYYDLKAYVRSVGEIYDPL